MSGFNMPHDRAKELDGSGKSSLSSPKLYRPLPEKGGSKVHNEVFIPLFSPTKWRMFNPTADQVAEFGLVGNGSGLIAVPPDLQTFYFKLPVHNIEGFKRPDGTSGWSYVICPVKMNDYLTRVLNYGPMFETPRCAFCEEEDKWYKEFNNRWEELGYVGESKKNLSTEEYRNIVENDPVLKNTRATARNYGAGERYVISIFDHDKVTGARQKDNPNDPVEHQVWLAPRTIYDGLVDIYEVSRGTVEQGLDVPFFDVSSPNGIHIITIIKDAKKGLFRSEYTVQAGKRHQYNPEWLAYLTNMDMMVDPSEFVFMCSYDEMRYYIGTDENKPQTAVAPPTQVGPPSATAPQGGPPAMAQMPPMQAASPPIQPTPMMPQGGPPAPSSIQPPTQAGPPVGPPVPMQAPQTPPAQDTAPTTPAPMIGATQSGDAGHRSPPPGSPPPGKRMKW